MADPAGRTDATPIAFNDDGDGWHLSPPRRHLQRGLIGLALLVAVLSAVSSLRSGNVGNALVPGVLVAVALAVLLEPRRPQPARMHESPTVYGLLLPTHPVKVTVIALMALAGLVLCIGPTVGVVSGRGEGSMVGQVAAIVLCLPFGALFVAGAAGGVASRRFPHRGIVLTVDGVVLQAVKLPTSFAWHQCDSVRAHWTRVRSTRNHFLTPDDVIANWLTFEVDPADVEGQGQREADARTPQPTVNVRHLAIDPAVALEVCRFYLADAEARAELRTAVALDRVASIARTLQSER